MSGTGLCLRSPRSGIPQSDLGVVVSDSELRKYSRRKSGRCRRRSVNVESLELTRFRLRGGGSAWSVTGNGSLGNPSTRGVGIENQEAGHPITRQTLRGRELGRKQLRWKKEGDRD